MGLFDAFRKKPKLEDFDTTPSQHIKVDLTEDTMDINGTKLVLPCHKDELSTLFGEPMLSMDNITGTSIRYIYLWHELGIVAFSNDDENVNCITFQFYPWEKKPPSRNFPKNLFGGNITVEGKSWLDLFKKEKPEQLDDITLPIVLVHYGNFTLCASTRESAKGIIHKPEQYRSLGINKKTILKFGDDD